METESAQIARFFKYPEWHQHYEPFVNDIKFGFNSSANVLLFSLCIQEQEKRGSLTPFQYLQHCLEKSVLWVTEETQSHKVSASELTKKANNLLKALEIEEEKLRAEENFRSWLQRTITCNATIEEPVINGNKISDPFQNASEKLAILSTTKILAAEERQSLFFPLADTNLEFRPRIPSGIDILDQNELDGGPEFDSVMCICGEVNIGKSNLGLFLLTNLVNQRQNVLLISGEDSPAENKKRILSNLCRLPQQQIRAMSPEQRHQRLTHLYGEIKDPQSIYHHISTRYASVCPQEGQITPQYIAEQIERYENEIQEPINAIMIDYLQKTRLDATRRNMQRDEELEEFVNRAAALGEDRYLTILISQIPSHAAGGKTEFLDTKQAMARSYAATWGAHYILTMNRTQEETERLRGSQDKRSRLNFFLCKSKHGPIGTFRGLGFPEESRWRFFREKSALERFVANNPPRTP